MQPPFIKLALLLCLALSARAQDGEPAALFERAARMQQAEDYSGAATAWREFLALRPQEVGALANLGVVLAKLGRYDEAIAEYEKADRLAPNDPRIALNIALAYSKSGRLNDAETKLEVLHQSSPQDSRVTLLLADTCLQLGENEKVVELLNPAKDSPDLAIAYLLGAALLRTHRIQEGQVQLEKILSRGDSAEARFLLGARMFESGDYPAAARQLSSAIQLNPDLPELQSYYGQALLFTGDADAATSAFQKALALNLNDYRANLGLGQLLLERKHQREALPLLRKAVLLRPRSPESLIALGHALTVAGDWSGARANLEAAEQQGAESVRLHQDLVQVFRQLKLPSEAAREQNALSLLQTAAPADGPAIGSEAPLFTLEAVNHAQSVNLANYKGRSPVVLVFGSYSCPNFRGAAPDLQRLQASYGGHIPFFLVYIREAHAGEDWQSTRNEREGVTLAPAATLIEKREHATMCSRKLHLNFPALVDGMDGAVERAYSAWPAKVVVVGTDGRILYSSRLTEFDFHSSELAAVLTSKKPTARQ